MFKWLIDKILTVRFGLLSAFSLLVLLSMWTVGILVYENSLNTLSQRLDARINLYTSNIVSELEKYEYLPVLLARDPVLEALFKENAPPLTIDRANRHLQIVRETTDVSEVFLMDATGTTLASSNWDNPNTFIGRNFEFRPYFTKAMQGEPGFYFALGTASKIPGYYLSFPIREGPEIKGVVVVKGSVVALENAWSIVNEDVLVTDSNGVIIISSKPAWKFRSFVAIPEETRQTLNKTRQYDELPLDALEIKKTVWIDAQTRRLNMKVPSFSQNETKYEAIYIRTRTIAGTNWDVHYLFREANLQKDVVEGLIFAAIIWMVLILSLLYLFQRRRMIENRLNFQLQHQRTLEQAAQTLEARVEKRTHELVESNTRLEKEIEVRLKAEKNLTRTQDELVQAGKLAALGQMAAGITHEMNQPLTAMRSYAENARIFLNRDQKDQAKTNLGLIAQLCDRLGVITNQLKVFSRKSAPTFEPVLLSTVLADSINLLETGQLPLNLVIENNVKGSPIKVMGETIRLEQVIINILKNAVDVLEEATYPKIEINAETYEDRVQVTIRDNGPGIDAENLKQIFDPFFTTKPSGQGLGLGLSLSSQIVQEFSGNLRAVNHREEGMIFILDLLLAREAAYG